MSSRLVQIGDLSAQALTLAEAREQLRVTSSDEDGLIAGTLEAVTAYLHGNKGILGVAFLPSSWRWIMSAAPVAEFTLPIGPVVAVTDIRYRDTAGDEQVFDAANYRLSGEVIELVSGAAWPAVDAREQAFWVNFTCGYGSSAAVPQPIKQIARMLVAHWYENRSPVIVGTSAGEVPLSVQTLITACRAPRTMI